MHGREEGNVHPCIARFKTSSVYTRTTVVLGRIFEIVLTWAPTASDAIREKNLLPTYRYSCHHQSSPAVYNNSWTLRYADSTCVMVRSSGHFQELPRPLPEISYGIHRLYDSMCWPTAVDSDM